MQQKDKYDEEALQYTNLTMLTIYKSFVRPKFHYTGIICDRSFNESLKTKTDMFIIKQHS